MSPCSSCPTAGLQTKPVSVTTPADHALFNQHRHCGAGKEHSWFVQQHSCGSHRRFVLTQCLHSDMCRFMRRRPTDPQAHTVRLAAVAANGAAVCPLILSAGVPWPNISAGPPDSTPSRRHLYRAPSESAPHHAADHIERCTAAGHGCRWRQIK